MEQLRPRYLSDDELRQRADDWLRTRHPAGTIPTPIEEIVELDYRIDIIPVPGFERAFEADGFISSDLMTITVDAYAYDHQPERYRFTLAHELAHAVLHKPIYEAIRFRLADEWKQFYLQMDEATRKRLEYQAYSFAGLILPPAPLAVLYEEALEAMRQIGLPLEKVGKVAHRPIAEWLGRRCVVSPGVIAKRLQADRLLPS